MDSFHDHAAFVLGRRGDILATNHLCRVLARAGMNNTAFGPGMEKNSRREVARQSFVAMMKGRVEIVGGDAATKRTAIEHRFLPETDKAARHATKARPRSNQPFVGRSTRQTKPNASR